MIASWDTDDYNNGGYKKVYLNIGMGFEHAPNLENFPGSHTVSRQHGRMYREEGQWKIEDLGSVNGIFIRRSGQSRFSRRITKSEILNAGDAIAFGKVCFIFKKY